MIFFGLFLGIYLMASIPALASPTFVTGANDALAVADVYNLIDPGVITDIESILSEIESISSTILGSGLLNSDSGTASSLAVAAPNSGAATSGVTTGNTIASGVTTTSPSVAVSSSNGITNGNVQASSANPNQTANLINRLGIASTQLNTAIRGLSANAQTSMTAGLNNNASSPQEIIINGVPTTVQSANYSDIAQVAAIINAFTNTEAVVSTDKQAFASIISGIVLICANLGIPNSFAAIAGSITDTSILSTAVGMCLQSALEAGDLPSVVSMANMLSSSVVINANPTLIQTYVSNFSTNYYTMLGYTTSQALETLNAIVSALDQIDPGWNTTLRGEESILNATAWGGANAAFSQLVTNAAMQADPDDEIESSGEGLSQSNALAYLFNSVFGSETVFQALAKDYPLITLTTNNAVALAVDPSNMLTM
jgi:hypothetical protein